MTRLFAYARATTLRGLALALLWWVLAEGQGGWTIGAPSVVLAVLASLYLAPPRGPGLSIWGSLVFLGFFLQQSVRGGVQVAALALRPRLDLQPTILKLPLRLPVGLSRVVLVNTLSLLPGSLSVRIEGDALHLHVLDGRLPVAEEMRRAEAHIARMLGVGT